jgi:hypothetical protein
MYTYIIDDLLANLLTEYGGQNILDYFDHVVGDRKSLRSNGNAIINVGLVQNEPFVGTNFPGSQHRGVLNAFFSNTETARTPLTPRDCSVQGSNIYFLSDDPHLDNITLSQRESDEVTHYVTAQCHRIEPPNIVTYTKDGNIYRPNTNIPGRYKVVIELIGGTTIFGNLVLGDGQQVMVEGNPYSSIHSIRDEIDEIDELVDDPDLIETSSYVVRSILVEHVTELTREVTETYASTLPGVNKSEVPPTEHQFGQGNSYICLIVDNILTVGSNIEPGLVVSGSRLSECGLIFRVVAYRAV